MVPTKKKERRERQDLRQQQYPDYYCTMVTFFLSMSQKMVFREFLQRLNPDSMVRNVVSTMKEMKKREYASKQKEPYVRSTLA